MMTIGAIIVDAADAHLHEIGGHSILGRTYQRLRVAVPELPVVVCSATETPSLRRYCSRSLVPFYNGPVVRTGMSMGWDAAVLVQATDIFFDIRALQSALALIRTGHFDYVSTFGNDAHPLGTNVTALRLNERAADFDHPGNFQSAIAEAFRENDRSHMLPLEHAPPSPHLDLQATKSSGLIEELIRQAGPDAYRLPIDKIMTMAVTQAGISPWRGPAGPLMIAEIGGNHEGDFEAAKTMAASAIRSGADCVKFQLYTGATLVSPVESPSRYKHFQKFELLKREHIYLAEMCKEAGLKYTSSVWDEEMLDWIDPYLDFYKVGSGDLTAWPILKNLAERGKPILLSTGLATLDDVLQTVAQIQSVDKKYREPEWMCVMQCTSMYPIPDRDANLRVMGTLQEVTGLSVGYSDHTIGAEALIAATAMGASALEFHFTDRREGKEFRDHKVSLEEEEVEQLKARLAQTTDFLGSHIKKPQESELSERHEISFRRAVYFNRDAQAGEIVREADLVYLRPAHGTDVRDINELIGKELKSDVKAFAALASGVHY